MKYKNLYIFGLVIILTACSVPQTYQNNDNKSTPEKTVDGNKTENSNSKTNNVLDLSNQGLEKIPAYVFEEKNIEELNISNNRISGAIQAEIRHLDNLKSLDASNNRMTGVPAEIGQLKKLEILDLSNNQITGLPYELGNLQTLKVLNLSGNEYSEYDLSIIEEDLPGEVNIIK